MNTITTPRSRGRMRRSLLLVALGTVVAGVMASGDVAAADEGYWERFDRLDRNDDGRIGRHERQFNRTDRNNDGALSGRERAIRHGDRNRDGYLNRREARHVASHRR